MGGGISSPPSINIMEGNGKGAYASVDSNNSHSTKVGLILLSFMEVILSFII